MSCGQIALQRTGIPVRHYIASEIDKHCITVTQRNYPNTIQLGDISKISVRSISLSGVYAYICEKYFKNDIHNLQSIISEWEMLYRIVEEQTMAAYFGTQIQDETTKISKNPIISINDAVWFWKCEMGNNQSIFHIARSGSRRKKPNSIDVGFLCKHSFWWNGNGQFESGIKSPSIKGTIRTNSYKTNPGKIKEISNTTISVPGNTGRISTKNTATVSRSYLETEIQSRDEKLGSEKINSQIKGNSSEKKDVNDQSNKNNIQTWNENDRNSENYRNFLSFHTNTQTTLVECEWGIIVFKGSIKYAQAGSPCQGFSFAGKGLNFADPRSALFFEFVRLLNECREINPDIKFLLENVKMKKEHELVISKYMGIAPLEINAALVSAQNRVRLYWTNINQKPYDLFGDMFSDIPQPEDRGVVLKDILEKNVDAKYYLSEKALEYLNRDTTGNYSDRLTFMNYEDKDKSTCITHNHHKGIPYNMICVASRGRNPENPSDRTTGSPTQQRLDHNLKGKTNTLTSVAKDNYILEFDIAPEEPQDKPITELSPYQGDKVHDTDGKMQCLSAQGGNKLRGIGILEPGQAADFRCDKGIRPRKGGKTPTLKANNSHEDIYNSVLINDDTSIIQRGRGFNKGGEHSEKSPPVTSNSWQQNNVLRIGGMTINARGIRYHRGDDKKSGISELGTVLYPTSKTDCLIAAHQPKTFSQNRIRRLTPVECERLQCVPDNYTEGVSDSQRYKMLGNGWNVEVIVHILNYLKSELP